MISLLLSQGAGLLSGLSWKTYGLALALAACVLLWLWIAGLRADLADLKAERTALRHRVTLQETRLSDQRRALETYAEAERQAAARRRASAEAREEAIDAPETEDGPVAPVLRRAFERLR